MSNIYVLYSYLNSKMLFEDKNYLSNVKNPLFSAKIPFLIHYQSINQSYRIQKYKIKKITKKKGMNEFLFF